LRISESRYDKDQRRYEVAWQMLQLEVRTKLICRWSGLSKYRIQTFFREYREIGGGLKRHRGMSPYQPAYLVGSLQLERESAAFTTVALNLGILPPTILPDATLELPSLTRGERLLDAYRLYRDLVPQSEISIEHAFLLITELAQRSALTLQRCTACLGLMVVDRQAARQEYCAFCRDGRSNAVRVRRD
jgi:Flagellar transcriptional activator (FlhC)